MRIWEKLIDNLLWVYGKAIYCRPVTQNKRLCKPFQRASCGSTQTQNQDLRDEGCYLFACVDRVVQILLSFVDDSEHNALLKLLGLEKAGINYKLLFKWSKLFCNTNINRLYFCRAGEGAV